MRLRAHAWHLGVGLCVALVAGVWLGVLSSAGAPAHAARPIELVESVPVETSLGNPELRHTREVWLEMIRGARRSIDVEGFYLSTWPGEWLDPVLAALGQAARRGVHVRLLFDRGMSATYPQPLDSLGKLRGFAARRLDMHRIAGGVQHAKYFLVDREQVFVGSQNFDWRSLAHIHELGVHVRDPRIAHAFGSVFDWDWQASDTTTWSEGDAAGSGRAASGRKQPRPPVQQPIPVPIRIVQGPRDTVRVWPSISPRAWSPDSTRWDRDDAVGLIDFARSEIEIQLLTYSPEEYGKVDTTLDGALRRAAARGVRVRLLISDWEVNGKGIDWLKRLSQVPNVEARLSTIPEWSGGYIPFARVEHCKYLVADTSAVWVGTSNWGPGYFYETRGLALVLQNKRLAAQARRAFEASWNAPSAAAVRADYKYPEKIRGETPPSGTQRVYGR